MAGIWIFRTTHAASDANQVSYFQLGAVISIVVYSGLPDPDIMLLAGAFLGMFVERNDRRLGALMAEAYPTEARATAQTYFSILVVP